LSLVRVRYRTGQIASKYMSRFAEALSDAGTPGYPGADLLRAFVVYMLHQKGEIILQIFRNVANTFDKNQYCHAFATTSAARGH
jgi:hypothetical protein